MRKLLNTFLSLCLVFAPCVDAFAIDDTCGAMTGAGVGGSVLCATNIFPSTCVDQDRDGYCANISNGPNTGIDCDDTNRYIYPGALDFAGCSANEARECQASGSYGSCSSGGYCPAGYTCKYFSPTGTDGGLCTFAAPCATPDMFSSRSTGSPPANFITPGTNKAMIFLPGTYSTGFTTNTLKYWATLNSITGGTADSNAFKIIGINWPIIDSAATDVTPFAINTSSYIQVAGFEVTGNTCRNTYDNGCVGFTDGDHNTAYNLKIHDNTGNTSGNLSGLYPHGGTNFRGHHLLIYDNIGTTADNTNNMGVGIFDADVTLEDSIFYYTTDNDNVPVRFKHALYNNQFVFNRNMIFNGDVLSGAPYVRAANNYFESGKFVFRDSGGPTFFDDFIITRNTVRKRGLFSMNYAREYAQNGAALYPDQCGGYPSTPTQFVFSKNVVHKTTADGGENRIWEANTYYAESTNYTTLNTYFLPSENLYYNSASACTFGWFESNTGGVTTCDSPARGAAGAAYNLTTVRLTPLFKESTSFEENPNLATESYIASSTNSTDKGWNTNWIATGTPTPTPTPTATPTATPTPTPTATPIPGLPAVFAR